MKLCLLIIFTLTVSLASAQSKVEDVAVKKKHAIELMDKGYPDEAIKLLQEAKKADKENYEYDYEIGYAYYLKEDYNTALEYYKKTVKYKNTSDGCFQMLGNIYDIKGDPASALKAYDKGLLKFPKSGRLYLEKGNVFWNQQKYLEALPYYEKGIIAEPGFPSNYYRATLIYCNSAESVWGMIYGEIFMNIERNTKRTSEISKLLYDTYKNQIQIAIDTIVVSFCKQSVLNVTNLKGESASKLPFGTFVYEPVMLMSVNNATSININTLDTIRSNFISNYYSLDFSKNKPNALFEFQQEIQKAGHMEAYNYWILMKGEESTFKQWQEQNPQKWDSFVEWFKNNRLILNENHFFYREQY